MDTWKPSDKEERLLPGIEREYRTGQIVVHWEPRLCIHAARCLRGLPQVFNVRRRPWINLEGVEPDRIAKVVRECPTSALRYERLDGGEQEIYQGETTIEAQPNGPLYVRGEILLIDQDRRERRLPRAALCRCGHSRNKPFCDGTHDRIGFQSEP